MDSSLRFQPEDSYPPYNIVRTGEIRIASRSRLLASSPTRSPVTVGSSESDLVVAIAIAGDHEPTDSRRVRERDNQSAKDALAPIDHRRAWGRAMARIVIVEDEIQVLMLAESVLQQAGHDTVSASTVAEAQALINSKDEKFDLVFADVELGGGVLALVRSHVVPIWTSILAAVWQEMFSIRC